MISLNKEEIMIENTNKKTYVITGATSGIGLAIMEGLAEKEMNLIGIGRSPELCKMRQELFRGKYPQGKMKYIVADLSLQPEVRNATVLIGETLNGWKLKTLDGLVNNAGTFTFWQTLTPEGFETQWAVNHLAPFLLTHLLLPWLKKSSDARVIAISSGSHYGAKLDWSNIQQLGRYNPLKAYKQSKLANVLFTAELNRRLGSDSSIQGAAADPGLVNTEIGGKSQSRLAKGIWDHRRRKGIPPAQSAAGIIKLLLEVDLKAQSAVYWKHGIPKNPDPYALNEDYGRRLWEISAQMTGVNLQKDS